LGGTVSSNFYEFLQLLQTITEIIITTTELSEV